MEKEINSLALERRRAVKKIDRDTVANCPNDLTYQPLHYLNVRESNEVNDGANNHRVGFG